MGVSHEKVVQVLANSGAAADLSKLTNDTDLGDLGVDSLDMSNFLLCLEEELDIKIPDEDLDDLNTINAIVAYIEKK